MRVPSLVAVVSLCLTGAAAASPPTSLPDAPPIPTSVPNNDPSALFGDRAAMVAAIGLVRTDDAVYLLMRPNLELRFAGLAVGISAPLALLSPIPEPSAAAQADTWGGYVRRSDWPALDASSWGHYLQLVRYVEYGRPRAPLHVRYGQLYGTTLGHGTLVDRYNNSLDPANLRPGLQIGAQGRYGGVEALVDSVAFPGTNLVATRGFLRPMAFFDEQDGHRLAVGVTVAGDRAAPRESAAASPLTAMALDVEYAVLENKLLTLVPYFDWVRQNADTAADGLHLGVMGTFTLETLTPARVFTKLEYRAMSAGYVPSYFDAIYDMQRFQFPVDGRDVAKASASTLLANGGWRHGVLAEASAVFLNLVEGGASFFMTPGLPDSTNLTAFATLKGFEDLKLSAYFLRRNFDALEELWALDERSVLTVLAMYRLAGPLFLTGLFSRHWARPTEAGPFVPNDEIQVSLQWYVPLGD
jgi:hypothetical protein